MMTIRKLDSCFGSAEMGTQFHAVTAALLSQFEMDCFVHLNGLNCPGNEDGS